MKGGSDLVVLPPPYRERDRHALHGAPSRPFKFSTNVAPRSVSWIRTRDSNPASRCQRPRRRLDYPECFSRGLARNRTEPFRVRTECSALELRDRVVGRTGVEPAPYELKVRRTPPCYRPALCGAGERFRCSFLSIDSLSSSCTRVESNHLAVSPAFTAPVAFRGRTPGA